MTDKTPDPCSIFLDRLNGVLDGDKPMNSLVADPHFAGCMTCRTRLAAAKKLAAFRSVVPTPSPDFVNYATTVAISDLRSQRRQRRVVQSSVLALAASIAVGVWMLWPNAVTAPHQPDVATVAPGVKKPLNEARDAVVSLSSKVADETLTPAVNLFAISTDTSKTTPIIEPATSPLGDLPDAAKAGLEPLVSTPRRALNLFIRDVGGVASSRKMNS